MFLIYSLKLIDVHPSALQALVFQRLISFLFIGVFPFESALSFFILLASIPSVLFLLVLQFTWISFPLLFLVLIKPTISFPDEQPSL